MVCPGSQFAEFITTGHVESSTQQASHFIVRVQVRPRSLRSKWQQTIGRNLGSWIGGTMMTRKSAYETQSLRPVRRLNAHGLLSPGKRQRFGNVRGAVALHKRDEVEQSLTCFQQFEPQT